MGAEPTGSGETPGAGGGAGKQSSEAPTKVATEQAEAALKRATETVEALRKRTDLGAKVLASAGSTVVAAIGIAKFSDLFPWPRGSPQVEWATAGVLVGFALMVGVVIAIAYRFWKVSEPVPMRSDPALLDLRDKEAEFVRSAFDEMAALNDVPSLLAYEARGHRLDRVARWLPSPQAERVRQEASLIYTEILATHARVRLRILLRRVAIAVRGKGAIAVYLLFTAGIIAFGVGADYLQSERTDRVTIAKACADARAVGAVELPPICGEAASPTEDERSAAERIAEASEQLSLHLKECVASATEEECAPIRDALRALLSLDVSASGT
jgi:hypothetical protein